MPRSPTRAVFTDLDDTLTTDSRIDPGTYAALCRLSEKGIRLVVVSGRPAGWADCLMRLWPLDAMIFENGAGIMLREGKKIATRHFADTESPERLRKIFSELKSKVPELKPATDQRFRIYDFAIDYREEPPRLDSEQLEKAMELLTNYDGITFKLSSIHVNYWQGSHTKVTAVTRLLEEWKSDGIAPNDCVYCGDSPNDEPLFAHFDRSVGVANVKEYLGRMKFHPKFITTAHHGAGFQELVQHLL